MKALFDLLPAMLFFAAYKIYNMYIATAVLMAAVFIQIVVLWLMRREIEKNYKIMFWAVLIFGTLTLVFRNKAFIQWKVSIVNWIMAGVFLGSQYISKDPLVKHMMSKAMDMPNALWKKVNVAWVIFFILCGILNLFVAFNYSENTWMNFKLFGLTGLTFIFLIGLMVTLKKYIIMENKDAK